MQRLGVQVHKFGPDDGVADGFQGDLADRDEVGGIDECDLSACPDAAGVDVWTARVLNETRVTGNGIEVGDGGWIDADFLQHVAQESTGAPDEWLSGRVLTGSRRFSEDGNLAIHVTVPRDGRVAGLVEFTALTGTQLFAEGEKGGWVVQEVSLPSTINF